MALTLDQTQQFEGPEGRIFFGHPVKLPIFEGPLDLLLYLIRKEEIAICEIEIAIITEQYLGYLALLDSVDMEVVGDFMVMAATLMELKSRALLPKPPVEETEEEEIDPRADFISRLLEYRRYKDAAGALDEMAQQNRFVVPRSPVNGNGSAPEAGFVITGEVSAFHLWEAFQQVLSRAKEQVPGEIVRPRFTVAMKVAELQARLKRRPEGISFFSLFSEDVTKLEVIITFLALLELIRQGQVRIAQPKCFGDITLKSTAKAAAQQPLPSSASLS